MWKGIKNTAIIQLIESGVRLSATQPNRVNGGSVAGKDHHPPRESPVSELQWLWSGMLLIFWFYSSLEVKSKT
jgi:hypothetical protein